MLAKQLPRDASAWFARMHSDARTVEDEAALERWLAEDPDHERRYLEIELLWGDLDRYRDAAPVATLRAGAQVESRRMANVLRWTSTWSRMRLATAAAAGAAALALVLTLANPAMVGDSTYRTAIGDRQAVQLADGSEVVLNTDTLLRVQYRPWARAVDLERGHAYFKVAPSRLRSFEVSAAESRIRALGTAFDVLLQGDKVKVTLIEGRVQVTGASTGVAPRRVEVPGADLRPGQSVSVDSVGISPIQVASIAKSTAWLDGRLVFENEPLQDAVQEVNRYSSARLIVLDESLGQLRISGVFRTGSAQSFVDALKASFQVETRQGADGSIILLPAASSPQAMR